LLRHGATLSENVERRTPNASNSEVRTPIAGFALNAGRRIPSFEVRRSAFELRRFPLPLTSGFSRARDHALVKPSPTPPLVHPPTRFHIGISGWTYAGWRGVFYPPKLPHKRELEFASSHFNAIEINGSFYGLQRPSCYSLWHATTPPGFVFSVKGSRFITHMKKLREIEVPLANFFASGILALKEKLGPILWQFPPNLGFDEQRFDTFFRLLPRSTIAAAELAKGHDARLEGRALLEADAEREIRHCVEVRHSTFLTPAFFQLLRRHGIAFVFADTAGRWPYSEDLTADFAYIRLHGAEELYASSYNDSALQWWAERLRLWIDGRHAPDARLTIPPGRRRKLKDAYVFFDNDAKVHAPFDAQRLRKQIHSGGTEAL
jgi:uncharacterized protein YecE (DUF72 family)